jgi:hypothetical protein
MGMIEIPRRMPGMHEQRDVFETGKYRSAAAD